MISFLRGRLTDRAATRAVIDVAGVGYIMAISLATYEQLPEAGGQVSLFTHLHVREDRMELFAFFTIEERSMFELLIGVSGIGPTLALIILSGTTIGDLQKAIVNENISELTLIKGVGKRTAERIVLDLREKVQITDSKFFEISSRDNSNKVEQEAEMALRALGMSANEASKVIVKVAKRGKLDMSVQDLIKSALRER
ncbi:MAG: Holliday junction branch migration protein RuvA [Candidatus Latescibacterota bacterium]|nr:Holliday junction branch migration protein RuvA [Candidatus Latescibacterota bacterium]